MEAEAFAQRALSWGEQADNAWLWKERCNMHKTFAIILLLYGSATCAAAAPCDGVDRSLSEETKAKLAPEIAKQEGVRSVELSKSFRLDGWVIILVDDRLEYLFYSDDPLKSHYVTTWGGIAFREEEHEIKDWTLRNAPGIADKLASCFAWHVTNDPLDKNSWTADIDRNPN